MSSDDLSKPESIAETHDKILEQCGASATRDMLLANPGASAAAVIVSDPQHVLVLLLSSVPELH